MQNLGFKKIGRIDKRLKTVNAVAARPRRVQHAKALEYICNYPHSQIRKAFECKGQAE
jgi:hypothetical protein